MRLTAPPVLVTHRKPGIASVWTKSHFRRIVTFPVAGDNVFWIIEPDVAKFVGSLALLEE